MVSVLEGIIIAVVVLLVVVIALRCVCLRCRSQTPTYVVDPERQIFVISPFAQRVNDHEYSVSISAPDSGETFADSSTSYSSRRNTGSLYGHTSNEGHLEDVDLELASVPPTTATTPATIVSSSSTPASSSTTGARRTVTSNYRK